MTLRRMRLRQPEAILAGVAVIDGPSAGPWSVPQPSTCG
jgi:hypothetical protein